MSAPVSISVKAAAARLKQARLNAGYLSASAAVDKLKLKYPTYAAHENGSRRFMPEEALRYADAFGVSAVWLIFGDLHQRAGGMQ